MNPNMRPKKLAWAFGKMGFKNVATVISSGNVVFDSSSRNEAAFEAKIEKALPKLLGFSSTTTIRSKEDLEKLLGKNPVKGMEHSPKNYVLVTFMKNHSPKLRTLLRKGPGYKVLGIYKREICVVIDLKNTHTPDMILRCEKEFGKAITSRTWKTVLRIHAAMQQKKMVR